MLEDLAGRILLLCVLVCTVTAIICPDKQKCQSDQTCCQMTSGQYGCCPFPKATCCSDKVHCCPDGHTCDLLHDRCVSRSSYAVTPIGKAAIPSAQLDVENTPRHPKFNKLMMLLGNNLDQTCLDGSHCKDNSTCCKNGKLSYGCCPSAKAVCCSDQTHCCPHGTTCDVETNTCIKGEYSSSGTVVVSESGLQEIEGKEVGDEVVCPGGEASCPEGTTCCTLKSGEFGCCPFPNAVCCTDHAHCCPAGAQCDLVQQQCEFPFKTLAWAKKLPAQKTIKAVTLWTSISTGIVCPDHKTRCDSGATCCATVHGYACCPYPHAVCCPDKIHCCPSRTHCNTARQSCDSVETGDTDLDNAVESNNVDIPWVSKTAALPFSLDAELGVVCPGGTAKCEADQTCCKLRSGDWGCCPLPNAVCCEDHEHCCPTGYVCTGGGKCRPKNV